MVRKLLKQKKIVCLTALRNRQLGFLKRNNTSPTKHIRNERNLPLRWN